MRSSNCPARTPTRRNQQPLGPSVLQLLVAPFACCAARGAVSHTMFFWVCILFWWKPTGFVVLKLSCNKLSSETDYLLLVAVIPRSTTPPHGLSTGPEASAVLRARAPTGCKAVRIFGATSRTPGSSCGGSVKTTHLAERALGASVSVLARAFRWSPRPRP